MPIIIHANYGRYPVGTDLPQLHRLYVNELIVKHHSKNKVVCNIVSAITLFGYEAIHHKDDWVMKTDSGLFTLWLKQPARIGLPDDMAVIKTIYKQLLGMSHKFPKDIQVFVSIPSLDGGESKIVSIADDGSTTSPVSENGKNPSRKKG